MLRQTRLHPPVGDDRPWLDDNLLNNTFNGPCDDSISSAISVSIGIVFSSLVCRGNRIKRRLAWNIGYVGSRSAAIGIIKTLG
jgi:hypothetical protein